MREQIELWPGEANVRKRPPETQCANCGRVVNQSEAFYSPTEDWCSYECYVMHEMSEAQA